ncbi:MAG: hypothetical protein LBV75_07900 [Paludibacter sp.]|jgi:hypothetical protein|nr:hypothetical protein [Paludibacter sp.]
MKRLLFDLNLYYYFFIVLGIASAALGYFLISLEINLPIAFGIGQILEYALPIIVVLIIITTYLLVLICPIYWRNKYGDSIRLRKYRKIALLRITLLGIALMVCAAMYFIMWSSQLILAAVALDALALILCRPNAGRIINTLKLS